MEMEQAAGYITLLIKMLAYGTAGLIACAVVLVIVLYIIDITQTGHTIRRNYPVIGRMRYVLEDLGIFFRQYFFAPDRAELPFNRAQRSWAYRAAKNIDNTIAFGSTNDLRQPGSIFFVNCPYPILEEDVINPSLLTFGGDIPTPYQTSGLFHISGMSYGAVSKPAVLALSHGARMGGCWMNTGEGGLSPYHLEGGADIVFQIGTAKNGVRSPDGKLDDNKLREIAAHPQVKMFELKLSQGAKPGKGGIVPAAKVTEEIARIRGVPPHQDAISPNRHPEIRNEQELLDMINHVRQVTGKPVGCKFVLGAYGWLDTLCAEITARGAEFAPDFITLDGADGGTGAAPMSLIDNVGLPLRESLPMLIDTLDRHRLRPRIKVIASGKLITAAKVAYAYCYGVDAVTSARGFMFALGCIQALQCNKNTCPTGITTHNPKLQRGLDPKDKATRVANYVCNMQREIEIIAHSCGVKEPRKLKRYHARLVMPDLRSRSLEELYPQVVP